MLRRIFTVKFGNVQRFIIIKRQSLVSVQLKTLSTQRKQQMVLKGFETKESFL